MFQGFNSDASEFLWNLKFNNERPWFMAHKEDFIRLLKQPMDELGAEVYERMKQCHPDRQWQLHISRIYRDARRLYGRGPYKDHLWFTLWDGYPQRDNPALWFEIGAASYGYGTGLYPDCHVRMENWRDHIDAHPNEAVQLAERYAKQSAFTLVGEEFHRKKADKGELLDPWYNRKSLALEHMEDFGGPLLSPQLPEVLVEAYTRLMPFYDAFRLWVQ